MAEELIATAPPSTMNDYHRLIAQECRRLSTLIENVLDFSRGERGCRNYQLAPTGLAELVEDVARLMRSGAVEKGLSLETHIPEKPLRAAVDAKAIQQALVNLVDNAIKYSNPGTTVVLGVETDPPAGVVRLWVQDQGVGIPAAEHDRIFERFYRCGSELRRDTHGAGLGLAIVKQVIEGHKGRVIVRSAPGQGSRFTLELPVLQPTTPPKS